MMMMGLGSLGYGVPSSSSSSSSSNLSPLAPPFTVDRFNLKPSSNPLVQFPESSYAASFGHTWQYSNPSAPDMYPRSELEIDSNRITSLPLPDDHGFQYSMSQSNDPQAISWSTVSPGPKTSSAPLLYDSKVDSFYPPYVSSVVNHDSPLVAFSEPTYDLLPSSGLVSAELSSQVDYTHSLHGVWNGTFDGKLGEQANLTGGSFLDKTRNGGSSAFTKQTSQENFGILCGQFSNVIGRESGSGLVRMECGDNMPHLVQKVLPIPLDSSNTTISSSSCTIPAPHLSGPSFYSSTNSTNYHMPQNVFERCIQPLDSGVSGSISVTKSSPALVIRSPPSGSVIVPQKAASGKTLGAGNIAAFQPSEGLGKTNPLKGKESQILIDSEVEKSSLFTSQVNCQKEGNSQLFSASSVMGEVPSKPSRNGTKVKFESPVQNIDATDGSSLPADNFQAIKSFDIGPDCMDHHSFAVDSPCWKGAPASHFSPFELMETGTTDQFGTRTDKFCQLGLRVDQTSPQIDPVRCSSEKAGEDEVCESGYAGTRNASEADSIVREQRSFDAATVRALRSFDAAKAIVKGPNLTDSKGVQFSYEPREDYNLPKHSKNDYESKSSGIKQLGVEEDNITASDLSFRAVVMDSVLNISDTTEGAVAVRAAENVLCSPSSEEVATEQAKPYGSQFPPKMDVQALIKALHSLSDLLLFSFNDSFALKDQEIEVIKHVVRNLDRLTSKKMEYFTQSNQELYRQDRCAKVGDSLGPQMSNAAGKFKFENAAGRKLHDCLSRDDQMRNHFVNHEKAGILQLFGHPRDDLDVSGDDNMAQGIRKVLEENFLYGEEMESQALLFKNLWLEAEAKLCSISYRARFEKTKMEMQKLKSNQTKDVQESAATLEKSSGLNSSRDLNMSDMPSFMAGNNSNLKSTIWRLPSSSSTSKADDVQASVVTRFDTLTCCDDARSTNLVGEGADIVGGVSSGKTPFLQDQAKDRKRNTAVEPQWDVNQDFLGLHVGGSGDQPIKDGLSSTSNTDDIEASVMTRCRILKCRDDLKTTNAVMEQEAGKLCSDTMPFPEGQAKDERLNLAVEPHSHTTGDVSDRLVGLHIDGPVYELVKDFFSSTPDGGEKQYSATNAQRNQYPMGSNDNCSSDWEHVLKDDVS